VPEEEEKNNFDKNKSFYNEENSMVKLIDEELNKKIIITDNVSSSSFCESAAFSASKGSYNMKSQL